MKKELISIIVPIYNVEICLIKCIDSIINQTYKNTEIILVDDGSTDNCGTICDNYKNKDNRIIVIHKKNEGLSSARNTGLDNSKGNLIAFVDSDDYLESNYLEELYNNMNKFDSDISVCNNYYWKNEKKNIVLCNYDNEFVSIGKEKFVNLTNQYESLTVYAWNKLYKRKIFENIRYPKDKIYEDSYIICNILDKAEKISYTLKPLYNYVYRKESISNKFDIHHFDKIDSYNKIIEFLGEKKYYDIALKEKDKKALNIISNMSKMLIFNINNQEVWNNYYKELLETSKDIKWKSANKVIKRFKLFRKAYIYIKSYKYKVFITKKIQ